MFAALPRPVRIALMLVGSRLLALVAMVAGSYRPRPDDDLHWVGNDGSFFWDQIPVRVLDVWGRWDTMMFYLPLARGGYPPIRDDGGWVYAAAYFPMLPSMMRGLSEATFGLLDPYVCGVLLAQLFLVGAVVYLDKLVRLDHDEGFAELVIALLMAYPGTHFLSCVYPESLALFLAVFGVYCVRTGKWFVAGLACMLAALTRSSGVIMCLPVAYELVRGVPGRWKLLEPRLLIFALPAAALGFWLAMNQLLYADPLYFMHVQAGWGRRPTFFLEPFLSLALSLDHHLFALLSVAGVAYAVKRRERPGYVAMATVNVLLPLSTGLLRGIHRYMASNFPLFVFLARALEHRPRWKRLYVVAGLVTMVGFAYRWGQGYQPN
ncbi:MAG: hypothetical protein MUC96_07475 [Myxococcaceae bacterium]|nr:hypothetical protein [Myxococcaceae bacterium]